jgi:DNA-binding beta-propeller fold protein YncE
MNMANLTLNCPSCGAPIPYDGSDVTAIECPFCKATVVIPPELRPEKPPIIQIIQPEGYKFVGSDSYVPPNNRKKRWPLTLGIALGIVIVLGAILIPFLAYSSFSDQAISEQPIDTRVIEAPTPTDTPEPSPTPSYAMPQLTFGQKGINPGQFNDSRYLTTDKTGTIYVADYDGGRIQAFDMTGSYISQWKAGDDKTFIQGLAADRKGNVYASHDGYISRFDGKTGEELSKISYAKGGEFGDLTITPEGNLAAIWYEGRWGMITSLEGHSEALLVYNPSGKLLQTITSPISSQTDDLALDVFVAIDGKDTIYLLSDGYIYIYSASGKFINKIGSQGDGAGQLHSPSAIRLDGQGQLYIADSDLVDLFTSDGHFITDFPTENSINSMDFDDKGNLWVLADNQVTQYVKSSQE